MLKPRGPMEVLKPEGLMLSRTPGMIVIRLLNLKPMIAPCPNAQALGESRRLPCMASAMN
jgi:hypothetical protein